MSFFDRIAPHYDRFHDLLRLGHPEAVTDLLSLAGGETLLDVGGGTGRFAASLLPRLAEAWVLDASPAMLARVPSGVRTCRGDAAALPFPDGSFRRVLLSYVLHHLEDPRAALREAARVVAPGGRVVVHDLDPTRRAGRLAQGLEGALLPVRALSPEEVGKVLGSCGLLPAGRRDGSWWVALGFRRPEEGARKG
ncbi:class I SAM-dependent methyltransferase [Aminomonas paucivorans]|uniref:class I SAM-dependent methyltransferase n=1 Tax=Aminomonas paucivorans TaxID=81412 RepID=UPI00332A1B56